VADLDDVILDRQTSMPAPVEIEDDGDVTPYDNSSAAEGSSEDMSSSKYPRYNKKDPCPKFEIGLKFTGKSQFKKAVIKHGLTERRFIKFFKNESERMIAVCEWATCQWRCLLSTNSRTNSWQIASLNNVHSCPPRRDNKLVTAARIAEKYEKFIMANPTWSLETMRSAVQEEMFADVSISKLKRAKSIVMQKVLDATKGQYQVLYRYQLELLRSNPGSTIIIMKEPNVEPPVFQRTSLI